MELNYFILGHEKGGLRAQIRSWTLQELLAVAYPYCIVVTVTLMLVMYCIEWDMSMLIYSSLPDTYKHCPLWFLVCLLEEANLLLYATFSVIFIFQLHILLPERLNRVLKVMAESDGGQAEVDMIAQQIRVIQLLINLFNVGHRHVIYCIKLMCLTEATLSGYAAVAYGSDNLLFLALASMVFADVVFLYAFVYAKAFAIPGRMDDVKRTLRGRIGLLSNVTDRNVLSRKIKSMPCVGIKVGDFHMLERESTPIFVHYVITNIVNLLVTMK